MVSLSASHPVPLSGIAPSVACREGDTASVEAGP